MKQNRQLPCSCNDGLTFGLLAALWQLSAGPPAEAQSLVRAVEGYGWSLLLGDGAVSDRPKYVRIKPGITRQLRRIDLIALAVAVQNRPQLTDVRHDDFVPKLLKLFADPDRVRPGLHRDSRWRHVGEPLLDRLRGRPETSPIADFSVLVEGAIIAPDLSKVDTDRDLKLGPPAGDFRDGVLQWLLHGKQSLRSARPAHPIYR